ETQGQLRDEAARLHVAPEDLGVTGERYHILLDASAARVVDADDRDSISQREIHDLDDLLRDHLAQRAAEHRRVMAEEHHAAAVDLAQARDDAIARDSLRLDAE